jgi:hypothetical protein
LAPGLWIGLAFAVPFSVLANVLTPWFEKQRAKRSSTRAIKRADGLRAELQELSELAGNPARHQVYLLENILGITLLTSVLGVFAGLALIGAQFEASVGAFTFASRFLMVMGAAVIAKECAVVLRKSSRIRNFEKYREKVLAELPVAHRGDGGQ